MPCRSCGSVNQRKFSAEMGIHFSRPEKQLTSPSCGYFQSLLSVWIVHCRNSFCRTLNCAYLQKATPLRQDNLELNLSNKTSRTDYSN